jgi:hypothetical protein
LSCQASTAAHSASIRRRALDPALLGEFSCSVPACHGVRHVDDDVVVVVAVFVLGISYICADGMLSPTPRVCGNVSVYCPAGSSVARRAPPGFYTFGGVNASVQTSLLACTQRAYCVGGEVTLCPAGRYGSAFGLDSAQCSGNCSAGSVYLLLLFSAYECLVGVCFRSRPGRGTCWFCVCVCVSVCVCVCVCV